MVPKDENDLNKLGTLIQNSENCRTAYVGLKKWGKDEAVDLKNNDISFIRYVQLFTYTSIHTVIHMLVCILA